MIAKNKKTKIKKRPNYNWIMERISPIKATKNSYFVSLRLPCCYMYYWECASNTFFICGSYFSNIHLITFPTLIHR